MTPRLSRIGLSIDPWELSSHTTGEGKVDFAGGSGTNAIRLRQAYAAPARCRVRVLAHSLQDLGESAANRFDLHLSVFF